MIDPTIWMLAVSNVFVFIIGGALTYLSLQARQRVGKSSLSYTTIGFGLVTLSTVAEVIYAPAIIGVYTVTESTLLVLYAIESLLIGLGLGSIYYSVRRS